MNEVRVVLLAKAPIGGEAKTRLLPALGVAGSARLARRLLEHAIEEALAADLGPVELCGAPRPEDSRWSAIPLSPRLERTAQSAGDLGQRLLAAAERALTQARPVLLIGTDCPALDRQVLSIAAAALESCDAVIVPVHDGGYALLGLRRCQAELFRGIAWSTSRVLAQTLERLAELGWSHRLLPELHDIDEPADLRHVPEHWWRELDLEAPL